MDSEVISAIASVAETITSMGILMAWVWAERRDNEILNTKDRDFTAWLLKRLENDEDDKERIEIASPWQPKN